jgi:predicted DNA-binding antitoxin AbrB/MazE fold protein
MKPTVLKPGEKRDINVTYHNQEEYNKWLASSQRRFDKEEKRVREERAKKRKFLTEKHLSRVKSEIMGNKPSTFVFSK